MSRSRCPPKTSCPTRSSPTSRRGSRWARPILARRSRRRPRRRRSVDLEKARQFWSFQPPQAGEAARRSRTRRGRGPTSTASCSPPWRPRGSSPSADADRHTLDPPGQLRPDRPAADARGGRGVRGRHVARRVQEGRRRGCSPRPGSASAGDGTGSTWRGLPNRAARPT